jgi:hypothetical protein
MKPAWNRGKDSNVVLVMVDGSEEHGGESIDDGPMTQRCVYVQDHDSQRWSARALAETVEAEAISSPA